MVFAGAGVATLCATAFPQPIKVVTGDVHEQAEVVLKVAEPRLGALREGYVNIINSNVPIRSSSSQSLKDNLRGPRNEMSTCVRLYGVCTSSMMR